MFNSAEAEALEEGGDPGEEADASDAGLLRLLEERLDEKAACSATCCGWTDDDGAYLGEVWTVDVKRGTAKELPVFGFDDGEGVDVLADLRERAMEEGAVIGVAVDEQVDGFGIVQLGLARSQRRGLLVAC